MYTFAFCLFEHRRSSHLFYISNSINIHIIMFFSASFRNSFANFITDNIYAFYINTCVRAGSDIDQSSHHFLSTLQKGKMLTTVEIHQPEQQQQHILRKCRVNIYLRCEIT